MAGVDNRDADDLREGGRNASGPTLLIDADDTLWENNIYFIEVTEQLLTALERHRVDREHGRKILLEIERKNVPIHGYGSDSFAISVLEAFMTLAAEEDPQTAERLHAAAAAIAERHEMEVLRGVPETLEHLARHYRLILVTKGAPQEQRRKLDRSGLSAYFAGVEVLPEKDVAAYRDLMERLDLDPEHTWMIGNSPRSDINPALEAGLNAVLVPHPSTWELEVEAVAHDAERFSVVDSFGDVLALFTLPEPAAADVTRAGETDSD